MVESATRSKNTLDLILTNLPSRILRTDVIPGISDHDTVHTELDMRPATKFQKPRKIILYKRADWDGLAFDFDSLGVKIKEQYNRGDEVSALWETFKDGLNSNIEKHIPHKMAKMKSSLAQPRNQDAYKETTQAVQKEKEIWTHGAY